MIDKIIFELENKITARQRSIRGHADQLIGLKAEIEDLKDLDKQYKMEIKFLTLAKEFLKTMPIPEEENAQEDNEESSPSSD